MSDQLPEERPTVVRMTVELEQPSDTWSASNGSQSLTVRFDDCGVGLYYSLTSKRWSIDPGKMGDIQAFLDELAAVADRFNGDPVAP